MRRHVPNAIPAHTTRPTRRGACRAFSLIEFVVVIIIVGLLASIALPRFADAQGRYRLRLAGQRLVADLELLRSRARQGGVQHTARFDAGNDQYELGGVDDLDAPGSAYVVDLAASPYNLDLRAVTLDGAATTLTFNGYGHPDRGGVLTLAVGASTLDVTIDADSGEVSLP